MLREILRRLWVGTLLGAGVLLAGLILPLVVLVGRRTNGPECGSAASCLLNAMAGGPRQATFSAWAWQRLLDGKSGARLRVTLVDALPFNRPGHCADAWASHRERGLVPARQESRHG